MKAIPGVRTALLATTAAGLLGCASPDRAGPNAAAATPPPPAAAPAKITASDELAAVAQNGVTVNFPRGGAALTSDGDRQLDLAVRLFRDANPVLMFTTGYSDQTTCSCRPNAPKR